MSDILWTGAGLTLSPGDSALLVPTPSDEFVLAVVNLDPQNNDATVLLTYGGSHAQLRVPPLVGIPTIRIMSVGDAGLRVANLSDSSPIWIAGYGPGMPIAPDPWPADRLYYSLAPYNVRMTVSAARLQQIDLSNPGGDFTAFALFLGSRAATYGVNAPRTLPDLGYTAVTTSSTKTLVDNWLGDTLYVVNLSPLNSIGGQVRLTNL